MLNATTILILRHNSLTVMVMTLEFVREFIEDMGLMEFRFVNPDAQVPYPTVRVTWMRVGTKGIVRFAKIIPATLDDETIISRHVPYVFLLNIYTLADLAAWLDAQEQVTKPVIEMTCALVHLIWIYLQRALNKQGRRFYDIADASVLKILAERADWSLWRAFFKVVAMIGYNEAVPRRKHERHLLKTVCEGMDFMGYARQYQFVSEFFNTLQQHGIHVVSLEPRQPLRMSII